MESVAVCSSICRPPASTPATRSGTAWRRRVLRRVRMPSSLHATLSATAASGDIHRISEQAWARHAPRCSHTKQLPCGGPGSDRAGDGPVENLIHPGTGSVVEYGNSRVGTRNAGNRARGGGSGEGTSNFETFASLAAMRVEETAMGKWTRLLLGAALAAAMVSGAAQTSWEAGPQMGKKEAITAVVDEFVARVAADTRINAFFAHTDIAKLKMNLVNQICEASGGPCKYTGRTMKEAHKGMGVATADFNALVEDLVGALDKFKVGEKEKNELLGVLGPMKSDIVEKP